jgi:glycosyl transferase family 25
MTNQLVKNNINNYEFIEAVDGKELIMTPEIQKMFADNNFNFRQGVVGCALSHLNLWKQLIDDKYNDYYLILEDDTILCNDFANKISKLNENFKCKDFILLGYHMFEAERNKVKEIYENNKTDIVIAPLNHKLYIGGFFCYSITPFSLKNGTL